MAKSPKTSPKPNTSSKVSYGALIVSIILALIVIGLGIAIIVLSCESPNSGTFPWGPGKPSNKCGSNSECTDKLCKGAMGCCAKCQKNGKCKQGILTANGCVLPGESKNEKSIKSLNKKKMSEPAFSQANMQNSASASASGCNVTTAQNHSDAYATAQVCAPGIDFPGCCGVVQNGQAVQGVMSNGVCQTQVQQDLYSGYGSAMPNTYLISTSGPKVQVTTGGCSVRPIQSSLQNYTGFFDACAPKAPEPDYGRQYQNSYAPSNFSSCG